MVNFDELPEAECLLKHTENRIKNKKDIKFLFTAETGEGKSYSGLRFLEKWYEKRFNEPFPIKNVINSVEEGIVLSKDFIRKGEGMLIEELSAHAGKRDALTTQNKMFNKFLDICRIKQIVIVGNAPHISFIDSHIPMTFQAWINCEKVDFKNKIVVAHPLWLQTSPHKKEPYKHRYLNEQGDPIDKCFFRLPSPELRKAYDKLKEVSNEALYEEIILKLRYNRVIQLKKIGQKVLAPREMEAYLLALDGYGIEECRKKMGLKTKETYHHYLKSAKEKLKSPEYKQYAKELAKLDKMPEKCPKNK